MTTGTQCRLAWEWLKGTFRYGQQGNYALVSLARFVPLVLLLAVLGFGSWEIARWREEQAASKAAQDIWFQFVFRDGIGARDLDGAWMLASAEDVRVREEFLRQLLNSDVHAEHLLMEPDFVVQALTIANPSIRETAAPIVEAALKGGRYDDIKKIAAIAVSTGLGRLENVKADAIIEAINRTTDSNQRRVLAQAIAAIAPQLKPEEAGALTGPLIEGIKTTRFDLSDALVQAFAAIVPQLKPEEARALAGPLIEAIKETRNPSTLQALAKAFAAIVQQLKPEEVRALAGPLIEAIKAARSDQSHALAQTFAAIAPQLKPEEARALADPLIEAIKETGDFGESHALAQAFAAIAPQLKPEEARALAGPLIEAIKETGDSGALRALAQAFAAIAPQLKPEEARVLAGPLIQVIKGTGDPGPFPALAQAFAAIAPQLKPEEAHALSGALVEAVKGMRDYDQSRALAAIAPQLKPEDARAFTGLLIEQIKQTRESHQLAALAQAFAAIAPQLKPEDARAFIGPLIEAIKETGGLLQPLAVENAIIAIAPQLKPDEARAFTGPFIEAMEQQTPYFYTIDAFAAVAEQLPWPERLKLLASALKFPTVYAHARDELIKQIKKHPAATAIKPPGDFWAVAEWLKAQPGLDFGRPPERMKTARSRGRR